MFHNRQEPVDDVRGSLQPVSYAVSASPLWRRGHTLDPDSVALIAIASQLWRYVPVNLALPCLSTVWATWTGSRDREQKVDHCRTSHVTENTEPRVWREAISGHRRNRILKSGMYCGPVVTMMSTKYPIATRPPPTNLNTPRRGCGARRYATKQATNSRQ